MAKNTSDDKNVFGMKADDREHAEGIYVNTDNINIHNLCRGTEDTTRNQTSQHKGSEHVMMRSYRSVTVCLVLLCVLLLTAVIVLCVLINTNNQQFNIKSLTEERDQLLTKYTNITEEKDQLLTKYTNITEEKDQLLTKYTNITEERHELIAKYNNITKQNEQRNQKINELWTCLCDGWIYYQSSLYFISSEKKSWSESRRYCRERGADLTIINNKEEQGFINKYLGKDGHWIGLTDSEVEGRWKWLDGSTQSYRFWTSGEPNDKTGDEDCVESYASGWNDLSCNMARNWICERH